MPMAGASGRFARAGVSFVALVVLAQAGCVDPDPAPLETLGGTASFLLPPAPGGMVASLHLTLLDSREGQSTLSINYSSTLDDPVDMFLIDAVEGTVSRFVVWLPFPMTGTLHTGLGDSPELPAEASPFTWTASHNVTHDGEYIVVVAHRSTAPKALDVVWSQVQASTSPRLVVDDGRTVFVTDHTAPSAPGDFSVTRGPARFRWNASLSVEGSGALFLSGAVTLGTMSITVTDPTGRGEQAVVSSTDPTSPATLRVDLRLAPGLWRVDIDAEWGQGVLLGSLVDVVAGPRLPTAENPPA